MAVKLNHTIVHSVDPRPAAEFCAAVFGSEKEFDQIVGRVRERGLEYWADPGRKQKGRIEIITRPYGEFPK
jgi:hypothetical protein